MDKKKIAPGLFPSLAVSVAVWWIVILLTDNVYVACGAFIVAFIVWLVGRSA